MNKIALVPVYVLQLRDGGYAYEAIAENTVDAAGHGPCGFPRGFAGAENIELTEQEQPIQADILSLMRPENAPKSTTIHLDIDVPEDQAAEQRTFSQELISSKGDVLNVEFRFTVRGAAMGEGQWATVEQWLRQLVLGSVQYVQADSESLAHVIYDGYRAQRVTAIPGETGMPRLGQRGPAAGGHRLQRALLSRAVRRCEWRRHPTPAAKG